MARQMAALDEGERKRLFDRGAEDLRRAPADACISPRRGSSSARRSGMTNLTPAVSRPQLLWAADTIAVRR